MAITQKIFSEKFDACGTVGFVYDSEGNDITSDAQLAKVHALYDVVINSGPWQKSWADEYTRRNGTENEIDAQLESNAV